MSYSSVGLLAMILHLIINRDIIVKRGVIGHSAGKEYFRYLTVVFVYYFVDVLWGLFQHYNLTNLLYIDTVAYHCSVIFTIIFWCLYVVRYLKISPDGAKVLKLFGYSILVCGVLALGVNAVTPVFFSIDAAGTYHVLWVRYVAVIVQAVFFGIIALMSLSRGINSNRIFRRRFLAIFFFSLIMMVSVILQSFNPNLPWYTIGLMIGLCILHSFIQEDEKEEVTDHLARSESKLKETSMVIAAAGLGIWKMTFLDGCAPRMEADEKMRELMGIPSDSNISDEEVYDFWFSRIDKDSVYPVKNSAERMIAGYPDEIIYLWRHPDLGDRYIRCGGSARSLTGGHVVSGYYCDVTEQRENEIRSGKIIEENIAANRAKTVFLQNMSHEIRTPLNAMFGFSQLLGLPDGTWSEAEKEEYNAIIMNSYGMLDMLIGDIIDIADSEHGNYRIDVSDVSVNRICRSAVLSVESRVASGVKLFFTTDVDDDYLVSSDGRRIQQVLVNYLTNACKHTAEGEIHLDCSVEEHPGKVTFSVADTGTGVPLEQAEAVFERFYKIDNFVPGSGLGLNICKVIAEKLGGEVYLDKEYTGGARFVFVIDALPPR